MQDRKIVVTALLIALMMMTFGSNPAVAFYHPAIGIEDDKYEIFGPRVDRILIKMYPSLAGEIAALQGGEIDITELPLTPELEYQVAGDPNIVLENGVETDYYTLNYNHNNDPFSPVYPNPCSKEEFRQACSYLIDRGDLISSLGGGFDPIFTPIPVYMLYWINPIISPGEVNEELTYPPCVSSANDRLTEGSFLQGSVAGTETRLLDPAAAADKDFINVTSTIGFVVDDWVFIECADGSERRLRQVSKIGVVDGKPYFNFTEAMNADYPADSKIIRVTVTTPTETLFTDATSPGDSDFINVTSTADFVVGDWMLIEKPDGSQLCSRQIKHVDTVDGKPYFNFTESLNTDYPASSRATKISIVTQTITHLVDPLVPTDKDYVNVTSTGGFAVGDWVFIEKADGSNRRSRLIENIGIVSGKPYFNFTESANANYPIGSVAKKVSVTKPIETALIDMVAYVDKDFINVTSTSGFNVNDWIFITRPDGSMRHSRQISQIGVVGSKSYFNFTEPTAADYPVGSRIVKVEMALLTETVLTRPTAYDDLTIFVSSTGGFAASDWVFIEQPDGSQRHRRQIVTVGFVDGKPSLLLTGAVNAPYSTGGRVRKASSETLRYWDRNGDLNHGSGEDFSVKLFYTGDVLSTAAAGMLGDGLAYAGVSCSISLVSSQQAQQIVMTDKDYNMYIAHWTNIGPDPDYLYDLYHSGTSMNFGDINDAVLDTLTGGIKYATNLAAAFTDAQAFQVQFATIAAETPLASSLAPKAFSKYYTGGNDGLIVIPDDGENEYRGHQWDNIVNQKGQGENSWWSTLNMHPNGHEWGDGTYMTVRYGWSVTDQPQIVNPLYSTSYWEWEVLNRVYDRLGTRNPYTLGSYDVPQLAENWTVTTWTDPSSGIAKSKMTIKMRPDVYWNDGVRCTPDDVVYTFGGTGLTGSLSSKGCADVGWQPVIDLIQYIYKLDDYTVEILFSINSCWIDEWLIGNIIIPKHFWEPFIATNAAGVIMGDLGTGLIGTGPFLYTSLIPGTSAMMVRNPTYYQPDEVGVIEEDPESGIDFVAVSPSAQITPVKVKDDYMGGTGGHFTLIVTVQNLNKLYGVAFDETITITYAGPGPPGAPSTLYSGSHFLASGTKFVHTQYTHVTKGLYKVDVTVQKTGSAAHTSTKYVWVTVAGDLDGNCRVNILDIAPIAIRFSATIGDPNSPPSPKYSASADVNHDGKINIIDIVAVAIVFGWGNP